MRLLSSLGILLSTLFILCNTPHAANDNVGSTHTEVTITNQTTTTCELLSDQLLSGNLVSTPPHSIAPNQDETFDLLQTLYGPALSLVYLCGNTHVAFEIQQDSTVIIGHTPTVSMLDKDGMTILVTSKSSSSWWNSAATTHIILTPLLPDLNLAPVGSRLKDSTL